MTVWISLSCYKPELNLSVTNIAPKASSASDARLIAENKNKTRTKIKVNKHLEVRNKKRERQK